MRAYVSESGGGGLYAMHGGGGMPRGFPGVWGGSCALTVWGWVLGFYLGGGVGPSNSLQPYPMSPLHAPFCYKH